MQTDAVLLATFLRVCIELFTALSDDETGTIDRCGNRSRRADEG